MRKTLIVLTLAVLSPICSISAFTDTFETKLVFTSEFGLAKYFVDPDVNLPISGASIEIGGAYSRSDISYGLGFQYSKVLRGDLDVEVISITAGTRYTIPKDRFLPYFSFDMGPCWLLSDDPKDDKTGYILDTGLRPLIRYGAGIDCDLNGYITLASSIKYNFTVKRVYFHNPFLPHKHKDVFHYFSLNLGLTGRRN